MIRYLLLFASYGFLFLSWAPSLTRGRGCPLYPLLALASVVFLGPSPLGFVTVIYCLKFCTSLFVPSYDSRGQVEVFDPASTRVTKYQLNLSLPFNISARTT
jgi:hypothetical protein